MMAAVNNNNNNNVDDDDEEEEEGESEHTMPTPRLVSMDFSGASSSPLSSNFAPETPSGANATFPEFGDETVIPQRKGEGEEGDDLHAQFCSVLLLDLGNGTAIPLSPSPGTEPRPDPFTLLAH